jgi:hypothetical protein
VKKGHHERGFGHEDEWGASVSELIEQFSKENGFEVKKSILCRKKATDPTERGAFPDLRQTGCDAVCLLYLDAILMMKTLKDQKAALNPLGPERRFEVPEFVSTLGDTVGSRTDRVLSPRLQVKPVAAKINAMYKAKTGNDLSGASARSFTDLQAWVHVLEKAGSVNPPTFRKPPTPSKFRVTNWWSHGRASSLPLRVKTSARTRSAWASSASTRRRRTAKSISKSFIRSM